MASGEAPDSVTLHSSWSGIVLAYAGSVVMVFVTIVAFVADGFGWVSGVLGVLTLMLVAVIVFDMPISTEFTRGGVTRRSLGYHQRIAWEDVTRLRRMRVGVLRSGSRARGGGLVAVQGRRNFVLVDTMEGPQEYDELRKVLGVDLVELLGLTDEQRPPEGRNPTWIYRRDKWRPEYARTR